MGDELFRLPSSGVYPWTEADYAYAGWVPNVSGHLSFNLIDPHSKDPTYNHQSDLSVPRTVAVHRVRLAQDYPFPDFLVKLFRRSAAQDFVLLAESSRVGTPYFVDDELQEADDANGLLMGVVAVLPRDDAGETRRDRKDLLAAIDDTIATAADERATCGPNADRRIARELFGSMDRAREGIACYFLRFALFRTGELRIWFNLGDFLGRDLTVAPADDMELTAAGHLAPQVYYFIKDLLHAHYHHDPHSDQLLPLTQTATQCVAVDQSRSEAAWRNATLRGLTRVVVELRQGRSIAGHQQAKGIIAYATAFQTVLARVRRGRSIRDSHCAETRIIPYDFGNLAMSLDAKDASAQSAISARMQFFAIIVGIILSGLALWAGAVQIQPNLCTSLGTPDACPKIGPGPIVSLVNWIVANPSTFLVILVTAGVFVFIAWFRGTNAFPWVEAGIRWLRRLSEALGVQISRWLHGMDLIGWFASLVSLGTIVFFAAKFAIHLAPTTVVPPINLDDQSAQRSPWAPLYPLVGQRLDQSGLLVRSVIAPEMRPLLDGDYADFLKAFPLDALLQRDGPLLTLTSGASPGSDGGYLIIDPRTSKLEAGLWKDGVLRVHRTQGKMMTKPKALLDFLGAASGSDAGPTPLEKSTCNFERGGTAGRTLHLSGSLRASDFCEYTIELHAGQSLSFDPKQAKGLDVLAPDGNGFKSIGNSFIAKSPTRQMIHVTWSGWHPKPADALKPRSFYVRLSVH